MVSSYENRMRERIANEYALWSPDRWHQRYAPTDEPSAVTAAQEDELWRYAGEVE